MLMLLISDSNKSGFESSSAMRSALCTCHAAQGELDEAFQVLESMGGVVPEECVKHIFRLLIKDGELHAAKELVLKYGEPSSGYREELLQALVHNGDLATATALSRGNLESCSPQMEALLSLLR